MREVLRATLAGIATRLARQAETTDYVSMLVDYYAWAGLKVADCDFERKRLALLALSRFVSRRMAPRRSAHGELPVT